MTSCIGHQTTHTCKLFDLFIRTTGTGVSHHKDIVIFIKTIQKCFCKLIISLLPCFNNFFVTLFFSNKTTLIVLCDFVYDILRILDHLRFLRRHSHIRNGYSHRCTCRVLVTCSLDSIKNFCCLGSSVCINNFFQNFLQLFLTNQEINFQKKFITRNASVYESKILRKDFIKQETSKCRLYNTSHFCSIRHCLCDTNLNSGLKSNNLIFISKNCFINALEELTFSRISRSLLCQVVDTKDHIL